MAEEGDPTVMMKEFLQALGIRQYNKDLEREILSYIGTYVTSVIGDALDYSIHAGKPAFDIKDVILAINLLQEKNLACPPSAEILSVFSNPSKFDSEILHNQPQFPPSERLQDTERKNEIHNSKPSNEGTSSVAKKICTPKPGNEEISSDVEVCVLQPIGGSVIANEESPQEKYEESSPETDDEMSSSETDSTEKGENTGTLLYLDHLQ